MRWIEQNLGRMPNVSAPIIPLKLVQKSGRHLLQVCLAMLLECRLDSLSCSLFHAAWNIESCTNFHRTPVPPTNNTTHISTSNRGFFKPDIIWNISLMINTLIRGTLWMRCEPVWKPNSSANCFLTNLTFRNSQKRTGLISPPMHSIVMLLVLCSYVGIKAGSILCGVSKNVQDYHLPKW